MDDMYSECQKLKRCGRLKMTFCTSLNQNGYIGRFSHVGLKSEKKNLVRLLPRNRYKNIKGGTSADVYNE